MNTKQSADTARIARKDGRVNMRANEKERTWKLREIVPYINFSYLASKTYTLREVGRMTNYPERKLLRYLNKTGLISEFHLDSSGQLCIDRDGFERVYHQLYSDAAVAALENMRMRQKAIYRKASKRTRQWEELEERERRWIQAVIDAEASAGE